MKPQLSRSDQKWQLGSQPDICVEAAAPRVTLGGGHAAKTALSRASPRKASVFSGDILCCTTDARGSALAAKGSSRSEARNRPKGRLDVFETPIDKGWGVLAASRLRPLGRLASMGRSSARDRKLFDDKGKPAGVLVDFQTLKTAAERGTRLFCR